MSTSSEVQEADFLKQKYPAKAHARKIAKWIKDNSGEAKGVIYLEGQKDKLIEVCFFILKHINRDTLNHHITSCFTLQIVLM